MRHPIQVDCSSRRHRLITTVSAMALMLGPVPGARADSNAPFAVLLDDIRNGRADARAKALYEEQLGRAMDLGATLDQAYADLSTAIIENKGPDPVADFVDDLPPKPWTWLMHASPVPPALPWEPDYGTRHGLHARYCQGFLLVWVDPAQQEALNIPSDMIQDGRRYNPKAWATHARGNMHKYHRRDLILGPGAGAQRRLRIGDRDEKWEAAWKADPYDYKAVMDLPDCLNTGPTGPLPVNAVARGGAVYDPAAKRSERAVEQMRWMPCEGATHPVGEDDQGSQKRPKLCDTVECSQAVRGGKPSYGRFEKRAIPHEYNDLGRDYGAKVDPKTVSWKQVFNFCVPDERYEVMVSTPCFYQGYGGQTIQSKSLWKVPVTVDDDGRHFHPDQKYLLSSACKGADIVAPTPTRSVSACTSPTCKTSEEAVDPCPSGYTGTGHLKRRTRTCQTETITYPWDSAHPVSGNRCDAWSAWQYVTDADHKCYKPKKQKKQSGGGDDDDDDDSDDYHDDDDSQTWKDTDHDGYTDTPGSSEKGSRHEGSRGGEETQYGRDVRESTEKAERGEYGDGRGDGRGDESGDEDDDSGCCVIYTELYRSGMLTLKDRIRVIRFTTRYLTPRHVRGYHAWAIPTVKLMRRYRCVKAFWRFVSQHRANEIAFIMGARPRPDRIGQVVRGILEPASWLIGGFVGPQHYRHRLAKRPE